ncbi:metal-dependent hydrolase family protein [Amphibacillus cookii]|uniref:metal-dependent hydrolase family protein n=1 Tax=Amphibacillus cookii TaxID=767787 RepID=UPI00195DDA62|nr:amidohydrolase family protein [Amphibacillus cookii]MBM7542756.1 imidazolonepropionase-like amidohydrolase [Amphibacillus cookii]
MSEATLYYNMRKLDDAFETFKAQAWFVVVDGRIVEQGEGEGLPNVPEKVNMNNGYVIPGLINCHTHITLNPKDPLWLEKQASIPYLTKMALDNLDELLRAGVTFFRDVGAPHDIDIEMKRMIDQGVFIAPDGIVSGTPIVMTGGHGYQLGLESDGVAEVIKHTRLLMKKGVGCIKLMATGGVMTNGETPHDIQLSSEEMQAAVNEAKHKGIHTAAHAQGLEGVKLAIQAGVHSIEHGVYLDDESIDLFLANDTYLCPTLAAPYFIVEEGERHHIPSYMVEKTQAMLDDHRRSLAKAIKAGVKIVLGTDAGTPFNLFKHTPFELKLLVDCGMSTHEAIKAATIYGAEMMGIEKDFGSITIGRYADFLVLEENPLDNIEVLMKEKQVYKKGKPYK